jgi:hypothetical protein
MNMSASVTWDDPRKTRILVVYPQGWSWDDLKQAEVEIERLLGEIDREVDVINHITSDVPSDTVTRIPELAHSNLILTSPNIHYVVVVGVSLYMKIAYQTFSVVYPRLAERVFLAATVEEARRMIASQRKERIRPESTALE